MTLLDTVKKHLNYQIKWYLVIWIHKEAKIVFKIKEYKTEKFLYIDPKSAHINLRLNQFNLVEAKQFAL